MSLVVRTIPLTHKKQKENLKLLVEGRPDFNTFITNKLKNEGKQKLHRRHITGWNVLKKYVVSVTRDQSLSKMVETCDKDNLILSTRDRIRHQNENEGFLNSLEKNLKAVETKGDLIEHNEVENIWDTALKMLYNHQDNLEMGKGDDNSLNGSSSGNSHIAAREAKNKKVSKAEVSNSLNVSKYRTASFDFDIYKKLTERSKELESKLNKSDKEIAEHKALDARIMHIEKSAYLIYSGLGETYELGGIPAELENEIAKFEEEIRGGNNKNSKDHEKNLQLKRDILLLEQIMKNGEKWKNAEKPTLKRTRGEIDIGEIDSEEQEDERCDKFSRIQIGGHRQHH